MASSKKSPDKASSQPAHKSELKDLRRKSVRLSVAGRLKGGAEPVGVEPINDGKLRKTLR